MAHIVQSKSVLVTSGGSDSSKGGYGAIQKHHNFFMKN